MLTRIEVRNFKSLKKLDYKCAKLNVLAGMNGAGKSSFVQMLLFLRSLRGKVGEIMYILPLKGLFGGADDVGTYNDLRYCYAKPEEAISFKVSFADRQNATLCANAENELVAGEVERIITASRPESESVQIWNPKCAEIKERVEDETFVLGELKEEARQVLFADRDINKYDEKEKQINEKIKQITSQGNAQIDKVCREESQLREIYESLWRNTKMITAFRSRPNDLHIGGYHRGEVVWETFNIEMWKTHSFFNPEGDDVAEYIYKFGRHLIPVTEKTGTGACNSMIYPGSERYFDRFKVTTLSEQIQAWLNTISPGAMISVEKVANRYVQSVGYGEKKFRPQNVGFGVTYVLPVLTTLLTSRPGDIVIIENPEAHLHPRGQAEMGNLLARAAAYGVQLFVETHSDHIINGIRVAVKEGIIRPEDAKIAFFDRKEHEVECSDGTKQYEVYASERDIFIDKNGALSEYPRDFLDEWNNQLMELI